MRVSEGRSLLRHVGVGDRRGAVVVEATLILPLFLIFWFGIVDWGITYWVHQTIVHQANMAARWGIVNAWDAEAIKSMVVYGQPSGSGAGMFGLTPTNVDVDLRCMTKLTPKLQSGGTCTAETWANSRWIEIVVHDYTWMHFTPFFPGRYTGRQVIVSLPAESLGNS